MNGIVLRLAGIKHPETKLFHQTVITIGTQADCDFQIDPEGTPLPLSTLLLELSLSSGVYRITSL